MRTRENESRIQEFFSPSALGCACAIRKAKEGTVLNDDSRLDCTGLDYSKTIAALACGTEKIMVIDLLGAGESEKPRDFAYTVEAHAQVVTELIERRLSGPAVTFGHSLGGPIALSAAEKCASVVRGLILSEANLDPSPSDQPSYKTAQFDETDFVQREYPRLLAGTLAACLARIEAQPKGMKEGSGV